MNKKELLDKCFELGLSNYKSKSKKELLELLSGSINNPLKPLIKWSGGKSDEIKLFEKHIPFKYNKYIELFVGGGALYFHLKPQKAIINDTHRDLIDFYRAIKDGYMNDINIYMDENKNDEETYYKIRDDNEEKNYI
jgi:DNA adenine methylase Dam